MEYTPLFITRYFKDERNKALELADFHVDDLAAVEAEIDKDPNDPTRMNILLLLPAGHGKTTLFSNKLPIRRITKNPNIRIMHIMNNSTDAEQNLAAIEAQLEDPKSLLVQECGPFKGKVWKATEFHVAGRTINDKDATFAAYGTGSNVFGHRADIVICDDILNLENAGPFASERTRQSTEDWFFQGVMKVTAPYGITIVIGTVMDFRDLYHKIMKLPNWKVIHRKAVIDDTTKEVLWPKRFSYEWLAREREVDLTSFLKRFQNIALETSMLTFPASDLQAIKNKERGWGQISKKMIDEGATTIVNAFDPTSGQSSKSKWCGFFSIAFNHKQKEPRPYYVLKVTRFRAPLEVTDEEWAEGKLGQTNFLIDEHTKANARVTVIEANGAHQYLMQSTRLRAFQASGHVIEPHYTSDRNKPDPFVGIPSIAAIVRAHMCEFPYGDDRSRREVDAFFEQEAAQHPMAQTTDRIMAWWFAIMRARSLSGYGRSAVRRPLPSWVGNHGLGGGFVRKVIGP